MLSLLSLTSRLEALFSAPGSVFAVGDAERKWTDIYDGYAKGAVDVSGDRVVAANTPGFKGSLRFASAKEAGQLAQSFDRAFVAYWTGATFAVGTPPTPAARCPSVGGNGIFGIEVSSVVVAVASGVLAGNLQPIFRSIKPGQTSPEQARKVASAFHRATVTAVTVLIAGTDTTVPTPLPVVSRCTVSSHSGLEPMTVSVDSQAAGFLPKREFHVDPKINASAPMATGCNRVGHGQKFQVDRGIHVSIVDNSAGIAGPAALAEPEMLTHYATHRAGLARWIEAIGFDNDASSQRRFVFELPERLAHCRVGDALCKARALHPGDVSGARRSRLPKGSGGWFPSPTVVGFGWERWVAGTEFSVFVGRLRWSTDCR